MATATVQMTVDVPEDLIDIANDLLDLCDDHPDFTVIESTLSRARSGTEWRTQTDIRVGSRTRMVYAAVGPTTPARCCSGSVP